MCAAYHAPMKWFDTHCHLDADYGGLSLDDLMNRAREAGVEKIVLPAVAPENWETCLAIAQRFEGVYVALGIHPQCVRELGDSEISAALSDLPDLLRNDRVVAVGELGIDHRYDVEPHDRIRQESVMLAQLDIAADLRLPPIIHCLDAHGRFQEMWANHPCRKAVHGIMHSYSGSAELVGVYTKQNLFVSYSGAVTWTGAKRVPKACAATPDAWLLVETDALYQPPHPLENAPNRPDRTPRVGEVVAHLRGVDVETVANLTWANAHRAFGLSSS